jgi:outer membrane protein assembly factor BamB
MKYRNFMEIFTKIPWVAAVATRFAPLLALTLMLGAAEQGPAPSQVLAPAADRPAEVTLGSAGFLPSAEHPIGYRGDGSGCYPGATDPCLVWYEHGASPGPDTNLLWKTDLGGYTQSHPIVVGNRLITLEEPNRIVCLDAGNGKLLWRKECDNLALFPAAAQARAHDLTRTVADADFHAIELVWEYSWLTGSWVYPIPGSRQHHGPIEGSATRISEIEREWTERGFGGTPKDPPTSGHGWIAYTHDTPKYTELVAVLADLQVDYGICLPLMNTGTQMQQHGQTQGTPTSDGACVYAVFATGLVVCLDLDGRTRWMKWFPHCLDRARLILASKTAGGCYMRLGFTGPSPLLVDDMLIVVQGYVIRGLKKSTGEQIWEVPYGNGAEADDGRTAYRAPVVATLANGSKVLVCPQGYIIRPGDGKVLCADKPMDMFNVPFGNVHCYVMGLVAYGDICYFTWACGPGAVRIVSDGPDRAKATLLWLGRIPGVIPGTLETDNVPRGSLATETFIENAPAYDPDRKRIYVSTHLWSSVWSFDAISGRLLTGIDFDKENWPASFAARGRSYCTGSNEMTDPTIVGRKYLYVPRDLGGCIVVDADDIHHVLAANCAMTQLHRDLATWTKPWSEIRSEIFGRWLYAGTELGGNGNEGHRTPGDPFVQGHRVYVRTIEGMTCFSSDAGVSMHAAGN